MTRLISWGDLFSFLLIEHPVHNFRLPGKQPAAAMLAARVPLRKPGGILHIQHQQPIDFFLGQPFLKIECFQGGIGLFRGLFLY